MHYWIHTAAWTLLYNKVTGESLLIFVTKKQSCVQHVCQSNSACVKQTRYNTETWRYFSAINFHMRVHLKEAHVKILSSRQPGTCRNQNLLWMIAFMLVHGHGTWSVFHSLESLKGNWTFSSCQAAQTVVTKGYKSLYHEAGLLFYGKKTLDRALL